MTLACRLIGPAEFEAIKARRRETGQSVAEAFGPGAMWFCPWYHDPNDPAHVARIEECLRRAESGQRRLLSVHYWRDWARVRPPITVLCPNGRLWCVDQCSSNGSGWVVTGEAPRITVRPSIAVSGYHGFLTDGVFSDDLDGRGPNGAPW